MRVRIQFATSWTGFETYLDQVKEGDSLDPAPEPFLAGTEPK
jgi:hypothetical protein